MKIKNYTMFAFLTIGFLFAINAAETKAQKLRVPPGSYQKTCKNYSVNGNILTALCNAKNGFESSTNLKDFFLCSGDIRNDDGTLKCTMDNNAPLMKKAAAGIAQAYQTQYGVTCECGAKEVSFWVKEMFKANAPNIVDSFYKGLSIVEIGQFMRQFIRKPENVGVRLGLINRAFRDVWGLYTDAPSQDVAFWNAEIIKGGNFYQNIVAAETKKLNAPDASAKLGRKAMIIKAYKDAMVRQPKKEDMDYWSRRTVFLLQADAG